MGDPSLWDRRSLVVSAISLGVAIGAFVYAVVIDQRRDDFQREVEERQSAPVLAGGVEPEQRGRSIELETSFAGTVTKPADRPVLERRTDGEAGYLLVVPVWNIGDGLAVVRGVQVLSNCGDARQQALERARKASEQEPEEGRRLGIYNVAAGRSEQLRYVVDEAEGDRALESQRLFTLVRYTDALARRERWTCMDWIGARLALRTQVYRDVER